MIQDSVSSGNTWQQTFYDAQMSAHNLIDYIKF